MRYRLGKTKKRVANFFPIKYTLVLSSQVLDFNVYSVNLEAGGVN